MRRRRIRRLEPAHDKAWHEEQMAQSGVMVWGELVPFDEYHDRAAKSMATRDAAISRKLKERKAA